ncbi:hypothetical protein FS837_004317, partial [Tulasnella sp. UAMH 9824]
MAQATAGGVVPQPNARKLTVAERLNRMSKYRIRPTEIEGVEKSGGRGRKAEVVRATCRQNKGARGESVAVKKLLCGNITDKEKFSK